MGSLPGRNGGLRLGAGRPRSDPKALALRGRKSALPALPDTSPRGIPGQAVECPAYADAGARAVWDELAADAIANRTLTPDRALAFLSVCETVADYRKARAELYADGFTLFDVVIDGAGTEHRTAKKHPQTDPKSGAWRDMQAGLGRFGLNGNGRPIIAVVPAADEWAAYDVPLRAVGGGA